MKPLVVEYIFDCYSRGRHCSSYDAVDGVSYTPRRLEVGAQAGDSEFRLECQLWELQCGNQLESGLPYNPNRAPLNAEQEELARNFGRQLSNMSDDFELGKNEPAADSRTLVQFESRYKFVKTTDGSIKITVVRSGNCSMEQIVSWKTKDNTALAEIHYTKAEGMLSFLPGENQKEIEVQILSDHFDNNINFLVELLDPRFIEIGPIKVFKANISDCDNLSRSEQSTIQRIISARIPTIPDVKTYLSENISVDTFKTALLCLCGNASSLQQEFKVAFDLLSYALPHAPRAHLMPFVTRYFKNAPEIENLDIPRPQFSAEDESEDSEESEETDSD